MIAETLSRQIKNLISLIERVAVSIKNIKNGSRDFANKNLDVKKNSVFVPRHIAFMRTSQINNSNSAVKVLTNKF